MTDTEAEETLMVEGRVIRRSQLRHRINDNLVVCDAHALAAREDELRRIGSYVSEPLAEGDCAYCAARKTVRLHLTDSHGNPICGTDFMAGTICTLPPGHDGSCEPACQNCGGDGYAGTCTCDS